MACPLIRDEEAVLFTYRFFLTFRNIIQSSALMSYLKWSWLVGRWDNAVAVEVFSLVTKIYLVATVMFISDGLDIFYFLFVTTRSFQRHYLYQNRRLGL